MARLITEWHSRPGSRYAYRRQHLYYLWVLPAAIVIVAVKYYPLGQAVISSLSSKTLFTAGQYVGLDNYIAVVKSTLLPRAIINNTILLLSVPLTLLIALLLTAMLYRRISGSRVYELLLYVPMLPAIASISVVFVYILSSQGPVNGLLSALRLDALAQPWLTHPTFAIWSIMLIMTWKRVSVTLILFMARMTAIDRQLFDAAAVDGASWTTTFRHIALPQMRGVLYFAATIGVIEVFSYAFAYIFILTQGGPFNSTITLEYLVYQVQFGEQHVGRAMAVAVLLLAVVAAVGAVLIKMQGSDTKDELQARY